MISAIRLLLRRGTKKEHESFAGERAEVTVISDEHRLSVHDGVKVGGHEVAKLEELDNLKLGSVNLTGNQTITGLKTFSKAPIITDNANPQPQNVVTKGYVDNSLQNIAGLKIYSTIPQSKKEELIFVTDKGFMQWNETRYEQSIIVTKNYLKENTIFDVSAGEYNVLNGNLYLFSQSSNSSLKSTNPNFQAIFLRSGSVRIKISTTLKQGTLGNSKTDFSLKLNGVSIYSTGVSENYKMDINVKKGDILSISRYVGIASFVDCSDLEICVSTDSIFDGQVVQILEHLFVVSLYSPPNYDSNSG